MVSATLYVTVIFCNSPTVSVKDKIGDFVNRLAFMFLLYLRLAGKILATEFVSFLATTHGKVPRIKCATLPSMQGNITCPRLYIISAARECLNKSIVLHTKKRNKNMAEKTVTAAAEGIDTAVATVDAEVIEGDVVEEAVSKGGVTDVMAVIAGLNNAAAGFYTSVVSNDFASKKAIAKALTTSEPVDEHLNEVLALKNFIVLPVELANEQGEVNTAPRVILITEDGSTYHGTSVGLLSSLRNLIAALGQPATWDEAVDIKVVQQKGNNGFKFFTINLV